MGRRMRRRLKIRRPLSRFLFYSNSSSFGKEKKEKEKPLLNLVKGEKKRERLGSWRTWTRLGCTALGCTALCVRILLPFYIHISSRSPRISHCASTRNEIRPLKSAPSAAKHSVSPTINNLLLLLIPFLPLNFFFFLPSSTKIEHFQQQKIHKGKERERKEERKNLSLQSN